MIKKLYKKHEDLILYICFGLLTTVVSWVTHFSVKNLFGVSITLATIISWIFAVTFAFVTNKKIVFKSRATDFKDSIRQLGQFYGARLVSLGIEWLILFLCADIFRDYFIKLFMLEKINYGKGMFNMTFLNSPEKLNEVIFKVCIASVIILIMNYGFSKLVVFRKKQLIADSQ